jgi:small-conductance mechanosensitive channel
LCFFELQLRVEEMNILTTVFLRSDNQKIVYPNSVLASKPIGNFYRSPDMTEAIDFSVHISTPMEKIASLKDKIKGYVIMHEAPPSLFLFVVRC